jgi:hypothetical protein
VREKLDMGAVVQATSVNPAEVEEEDELFEEI